MLVFGIGINIMSKILARRSTLIILFFLIPLLSYLASLKNPQIWLDTLTYETYYDYGRYYDFSYIFHNVQDPLFTFFNRISYLLGLDFDEFSFLCAFITVLLKLFSFQKATNNFYSLILLYISYLFILHDYIQIRVSLALALVVFSIYIIKNKYLRFLLLIFSLFIHISIILVLISYYTEKYALKRKLYFGFTLVSILLLGIVFSYLAKVGLISDGRAEYYMTTDKFSISLFTPRPILQLLGVLLIYIKYGKSQLNFEFYISCIGVILFYELVVFSPVIASRFFDITSLFFIILLSRLYKDNVYLFTLFILTILVGFYHLIFSPSAYLGFMGSFVFN